MLPAIWITLAALAASPSQPEARVIEQGVEDVSPLAQSTRHNPKDFRRPSGFEKVYSNQGDALFPPNMVFHIGAAKLLESSNAPQQTAAPASNRLDHSIQRSAQTPARKAAPESTRPAEAETIPGPPSIVINEFYRRVRIAQLLQSAAEPA